MLFSNNGCVYSLEANRRAEKNFCGDELLAKDDEKGGCFVDAYINDVEGLEDALDVDFFNNLPTPVDDVVKPWFSKQLMSFEKAFENVPATANALTRSPAMDFVQDKFQDLSPLVSKREAMIVEDSLSTPVIDPNSTLLSNGPFYQTTTQAPEELSSCGSPDDICGSFTIVSVCNSLPSSTQTMSNNVNNNVTNVSSTFRNINNAYSSISSFTPSSIGAHTNSAAITYTPTASNAYSFPTPSSTRSCTPSITPSVTPSSSSSSLIYTELKPRAMSSPSTIDLSMMPTVIADHLYFSKSSTSGQAPSPCPSTSSMTSSSTVDTKDFKRLSLDCEDLDVKPKKDIRRKNNEASRRSRMTKKQKYDDMVMQEKALTQQNAEMKAKVSELEAVTSHLRNYLMGIMKKGANK